MFHQRHRQEKKKPTKKSEPLPTLILLLLLLLLPVTSPVTEGVASQQLPYLHTTLLQSSLNKRRVTSNNRPLRRCVIHFSSTVIHYMGVFLLTQHVNIACTARRESFWRKKPIRLRSSFCEAVALISASIARQGREVRLSVSPRSDPGVGSVPPDGQQGWPRADPCQKAFWIRLFHFPASAAVRMAFTNMGRRR